MQQILVSSIILINFISPFYAYAGSSVATNNLTGKYTCTGYDKKDKGLEQNLIIKLDSKNSILENGYAAYSFKAEVPSTLVVKGLPPNIVITGSMASSGNTFSMNFQNTNPKAPADHGTVIGVATYDKDKSGIGHTMLHLFSYQPDYKGGDNSIWTCTKDNG